MNKKFQWMLILFLTCILFLYGLATQNIIVNIVAILLAFLISKRGYNVLFAEYDEKMREKKEFYDKLNKNWKK